MDLLVNDLFQADLRRKQGCKQLAPPAGLHDFQSPFLPSFDMIDQ